MKKLVSELKPGDLIDLEGDKYADPRRDHPSFQFEYALVDTVKRETPNCIAIWIDGVDCFGFPPDHLVDAM